MSDTEKLAEIVNRTKLTVPGLHKLVLFGSRARGGAQPESDYDLIAIVDSVPARGPRTVAWRLALMGLRSSIDLLMMTQSEWNQSRDFVGSAVAAAAREGRIVYER